MKTLEKLKELFSNFPKRATHIVGRKQLGAKIMEEIFDDSDWVE